MPRFHTYRPSYAFTTNGKYILSSTSFCATKFPQSHVLWKMLVQFPVQTLPILYRDQKRKDLGHVATLHGQ